MPGNRYEITFVTKGAQRAQKQAKGVSGALGGVAGKAMVAGAAFFAARGLINAFKSSVEAGKKFEQSMANLKALTGATGISFLKLEQDAMRLGAATKFTASQVGELQTEYGKLGFTSNEILGATEATLALAAAAGEDLATSATVAGATLKGFGIDASKTHRVTDVMAKSFASSALDMNKFSESMKYVAPIAKAAGFEIEDTTAILGTLANVGIHGSMAGTALKNIFIGLADESSGLAERLGGTVSTTAEMSEKFQMLRDEGFDLAEAVELVGKRSAPAFLAMVNGADNVKDLTEAFKNAGGAAQLMADIQMNTLEGKMLTMASATEGLQISFYELIDGGMKDWVDGFTGMISAVNSWIKIPVSDKMAEENAELSSMFTILMDVNTTQDSRNRAIATLQTKYPDYISNINLEKAGYEDLKKALAEANEEFDRQIKLQVANEVLAEARENLKDANVALFESQDKYNQALEREANEGWFDKIKGSMDSLYESSDYLSFAVARNKKAVEEAGGEYSRIELQLQKTGFIVDETETAVNDLGEAFAQNKQHAADFISEFGEMGGKDMTPPKLPPPEAPDKPDIPMDDMFDTYMDELESGFENVDVPKMPGLETFEIWDAPFPDTFFKGMSVAFANAGEKDEEFWTGLSESMQSGLETTQLFTDAASDIMGNYFNMEKQKLDEQMAAEIKAVKDGPLSEEQKKKKIADIQKKYQDKELELKKKMKPVKIAEAISSTAMAVAKALGSTVPPWNFVLAAMVGAAGALEVATINAQPYKKGGVVGGEGFGDKVPAMLEPGETVVPRGVSGAPGLGGGGSVTINITGNVLSKDFIEDEAVPLLEEALRKGGTIGIG